MDDQLEFTWGDACQCAWTIKKLGKACAVCRISQYLDSEFTDHYLEMVEEE